jgi:hypothetical protein
MDEIEAARARGGQELGARTRARLRSTEQLQDQLATLAWLKKQPFARPTQIAVMDNSVGGIETVLGAEHACSGNHRNRPILLSAMWVTNRQQSLAVGATGTPTTLVGPLNNMWVSAFMTTPTPGDYASQVVYLNELIPSASDAGSYSYGSEVLSATGTVLAGPQSNATFVEVPRCDASQRGTPLANYYAPVLQFSGITDANGMLGGSTVTYFEISGPPNPPLQGSNGNNFLVPANSAPVLCAVSGSVLTGGLVVGPSQIPGPGSNPIYSTLIPQLFSTLLPQTGIAINLSSGQIAEIAGATQGY